MELIIELQELICNLQDRIVKIEKKQKSNQDMCLEDLLLKYKQTGNNKQEEKKDSELEKLIERYLFGVLMKSEKVEELAEEIRELAIKSIDKIEFRDRFAGYYLDGVNDAIKSIKKALENL